MKRLRARLWLVLIAAAVLFIGGAALHGYGIRWHFERGAVAVEATVTAVETQHHEGYYTRVRPLGAIGAYAAAHGLYDPLYL